MYVTLSLPNYAKAQQAQLAEGATGVPRLRSVAASLAQLVLTAIEESPYRIAFSLVQPRQSLLSVKMVVMYNIMGRQVGSHYVCAPPDMTPESRNYR